MLEPDSDFRGGRLPPRPWRVLVTWLCALVLIWLAGSISVYLIDIYVWRYLVEGFLLIMSLVAAWNMGVLRGIQARSKSALAELAAVVIFLTLFGVSIGTYCGPELCVASVDYSTLIRLASPAFLPSLVWWVLVAITEETMSRGFVFRAVHRILGAGLGGGVIAVLLSAAFFTLLHIFVATQVAAGLGLFAPYPVQVFIAGAVFGISYWLTNWNLSVAIFMHFFYDAFANTLNPNLLGQSVWLGDTIGLVILPGLVAIALHLAVRRNARPSLQHFSSVGIGSTLIESLGRRSSHRPGKLDQFWRRR